MMQQPEKTQIGQEKKGMNKIIAIIISGASFLFGVVVIFFYGGQGGSAAYAILGLLGMPATLINMFMNNNCVNFLYFFQYQLLAFLVFKYIKSNVILCLVLAVFLAVFFFNTIWWWKLYFHH